MDLTTRYLGLNLRTPLVPSASPLSKDVDGIRKMEDAGAAAVVLHSLFEEQVKGELAEVQAHLMYGTESFADKEKGLASDSFKRAGFNWGIGKELYDFQSL